MKSNIKHFTRRSLFFFAFAMAYSGVMTVLSYEGNLSESINWFFIGPAAMCLGTQINLLKSEVPLTLGFGSTRKNIFRGVVWYQVLNVLLSTAAMAVITLVVNKEMSPVFMAGAIMILTILTQSIGAFMGIAIYKLKGATAFIVIFMVSVMLSLGVVIGLIVFRAEMAMLMSNAGLYVVVAFVFVLWGLALLIQRRMIYKYSL